MVNRLQIVPKSADYHADLAGVDNIPVQLSRYVVHILIQLFPAFFSRKPVTALNDLLHNVGAAFSHLGFDEKNILTHIDAIDDGLFPGIFANHILIEEGKGALIRRSSESNKESIEIR